MREALRQGEAVCFFLLFVNTGVWGCDFRLVFRRLRTSHCWPEEETSKPRPMQNGSWSKVGRIPAGAWVFPFPLDITEKTPRMSCSIKSEVIVSLPCYVLVEVSFFQPSLTYAEIICVRETAFQLSELFIEASKRVDLMVRLIDCS